MCSIKERICTQKISVDINPLNKSVCSGLEGPSQVQCFLQDGKSGTFSCYYYEVNSDWKTENH